MNDLIGKVITIQKNNGECPFYVKYEIIKPYTHHVLCKSIRGRFLECFSYHQLRINGIFGDFVITKLSNRGRKKKVIA